MRVIEEISALSVALEVERLQQRSVGLVPTMGALHAGHASLVERAAAECHTVCATVFVNPLQFGPGEDFDAYPRHLERDVSIAETAGAAFVFAPSVKEMFPDAAVTSVRVERLSAVLDGASRPGHFDGVATVVAKLFAMVGRCRAYFGEKDWQQLAIVRRLTADLSFPVTVVGCTTVRERDGLAMSSRNAYLSPDERAAAPVLFRALQSGAAAAAAGETDPSAVRDLMGSIIEAEPLSDLDYAEVVEAETLEPAAEMAGDLRLLVAARFGTARLIDNVGVTL